MTAAITARADFDPGDRIVVVGAGGHAKVVIELARAVGLTVVGCTAQPPSGGNVVGTPVLGDDSVLPSLLKDGVKLAFVALGDNRLRVRIGRQLQSTGFSLPTIVSPRAIVSESVTLGAGVAIMAGAVINADTYVGDFAIINTGACVDHDGNIGEGAHIAPGANLSGSVNVGAGALVGVGASVLPGITIGTGAILGGGSAAISDVPNHATAVGVPARVKVSLQDYRS